VRGGTLFLIKRSKSTPEGPVKVPAEMPLELNYSEQASGGRYCNLGLSVTLKQGREYALVGGFAYESGPIPLLTGTRRCELGVVDTATKLPVPAKRLRN